MCLFSPGCFYDFHTLDMIELGIENYKPISSFKVTIVLNSNIGGNIYILYIERSINLICYYLSICISSIHARRSHDMILMFSHE